MTTREQADLSDKPKDPTGAERKRRHRMKGRRLDVVLRDPVAIARLAELVQQHGSERSAVEVLLAKSATKLSDLTLAN